MVLVFVGSVPPGVEGLGEAGDFVGMLVGEVGQLVGVVHEHVEFGFAFGVVLLAVRLASVLWRREIGGVVENEFPIAFDDVAGLEVGDALINASDVVGMVDAEDGVAFLKGGAVAEVDAGHGLGDISTGEFQNGGGDVDGGDRGGFVHEWFDVVGPLDRDGGADAAFVDVLFGEGGVAAGVGGLDPAVVGDVDDDGVFGESALVEFVEEFTAGLVEPLDHGVVAGHMGGIGEGLVLFEEFLGRIVWGVGEEGGVPDEEGFFLGLGGVEETADVVDAFAGDLESGVSMAAAALWIGVGHGVGEAGNLGVTLPPLAGLEGEVAVLAEFVGDARASAELVVELLVEFRAVRRFAAGLFFAIWAEEVIAGDAVLVGIEAGEEGGE